LDAGNGDDFFFRLFFTQVISGLCQPFFDIFDGKRIKVLRAVDQFFGCAFGEHFRRCF